MTITPPPERKNFNSEKEYKEARKEWGKNFKRVDEGKKKETSTIKIKGI